MLTFDLGEKGLRALHEELHAQTQTTNETAWEIVNPKGSHAIAVGLDAPIEVTVRLASLSDNEGGTDVWYRRTISER